VADWLTRSQNLLRTLSSLGSKTFRQPENSSQTFQNTILMWRIRSYTETCFPRFFQSRHAPLLQYQTFLRRSNGNYFSTSVLLIAPISVTILFIISKCIQLCNIVGLNRRHNKIYLQYYCFIIKTFISATWFSRIRTIIRQLIKVLIMKQ
jgi:hypothetical protein